MLGVGIDPQYPLLVMQGNLKKSVENKCGTIEAPPCLGNVSAEHNPKFCSSGNAGAEHKPKFCSF